MSNEKIIVNISSSGLGHTGCILAQKRTIIDGYQELAPDAKLIYGIAIHKFLEVMYKTKGHIPSAREKAFQVFDVQKVLTNSKQGHLLDRNHMMATAYNVWETYAKEESGFEMFELNLPCWECKGEGDDTCKVCNGKKHFLQPSVELNFSIKYYEDEYIIVNLCGTIDRIGKVTNGCYAIRDWKTTSSWDAKHYFSQYAMSRPLRLYRLALKLMSNIYPDSILGTIGKTNVGCFIDAIFIKPFANDVKVANSDVIMFSEKDLNDFQLTLDDKIKEFSSAVKTGYYPKQGIISGTCKHQWGMCQYWDVCSNPDNVGEILLTREFKKRPFDPLNYRD